MFKDRTSLPKGSGSQQIAKLPVSPSAFSRRVVVSYWRKYVHELLVNRLGGLSLPRKSVVRLTDRPNMTFDVYRGRKTTIQYCTGKGVKIWSANQWSRINSFDNFID